MNITTTDTPEKKELTWDEPAAEVVLVNRGSYVLTPDGPSRTLLVITEEAEIRHYPDFLVRATSPGAAEDGPANHPGTPRGRLVSVPRRPCLALPFTVLAGADAVHLVAGEEFRYTLNGPGLEALASRLALPDDGPVHARRAVARVGRARARAALAAVERLAGERVLIDGPAVEAHPARRYRLAPEGRAAWVADLQSSAHEEETASLPVLCQDTLDYDEALGFNRRCLAAAGPWLWVSTGPLVRGLVSPVFLPDAGPCLACLPSTLPPALARPPALRRPDRARPKPRVIRGGALPAPRTGRPHRTGPLEGRATRTIRRHRRALRTPCPGDGLDGGVGPPRPARPGVPRMSRPAVKPPWYRSPFGGLFTPAELTRARAHDPDVRCWAGLAPSPRHDLPAITGGAAGWDDVSAEAAGVGEAIERWQGWRLPGDEVIEASFASWPRPEPAIAPERWVLFHPEQYALPDFPFGPLRPETVCRWVCFRAVGTGLPFWVPEELTYLRPAEGECTALCPMTSTGLSAGRVGQPVVLRGLQECIERDALMGAWWGSYGLEEHPAEEVFDFLPREFPRRLRRPNLRPTVSGVWFLLQRARHAGRCRG